MSPPAVLCPVLVEWKPARMPQTAQVRVPWNRRTLRVGKPCSSHFAASLPFRESVGRERRAVLEMLRLPS